MASESIQLTGLLQPEVSIRIGEVMARRVFAKRGNNSEVHLTELELAAMLALAAEEAFKRSKP